MCGIFFSLSTSKPTPPAQETCSLLQKRGPDSVQTHTVQKEVDALDEKSPPCSYHLTFISSVLSLRGNHVYSQPIVDHATQSVLCWNGEAWKIAGEKVQGNDTERVFDLFLQAIDCCDRKQATERLADAIASISGPFAFVFYDAVHSRLFFSRDCLGRRSLLQGVDKDGALKICSICDGSSSTHFEEVRMNGVAMIDLGRYGDSARSPGKLYEIQTLPWSSDPSPPVGHLVCVAFYRSTQEKK
ncbi:Asparagine synthase related protein [Penicillium alfredii]|uniref:Asparagine synthase related protein n=1 Tax=Penicillium alfredii TaxID=1506179 RepID=A0A9W9ERJ8_9EURO|nr:Asparagine synthase related protein [Penicillium alfredii]KAJ5086599.1 Asparagine synthase related protein [Penicillium alfredii]